jgi:hypothetical protein
MKNVTEGLKETLVALNDLAQDINAKKHIERIHKENLFNRMFSSVLDCFSDFEAVGERLEEGIAEVEFLHRKMRSIEQGKNTDIIPDEIQKLMKQADKISKGTRADFKSLYTFGKIFLDQYTALIRFLFNWRGIGSQSVTNFFYDLEKYSGDEKQVVDFKEECLKRLKAVDVFVTQYRDKYIVHDQTSHKETRWFLNEMDGSVRFLGGRPSVTPTRTIICYF